MTKTQAKALAKITKPSIEKAMDVSDLKRLHRLERIVRDNIAGFHKFGQALISIRDERLYRRDFKTFEEYCQEKWGLGKAYTYRLIGASEVAGNLSSAGMPMPANERQARELAGLPPEKQLEVWTEVLARAEGGEVTAEMIKEVVGRRCANVARLTSSKSVEWYTPDEYAQAAREVLDGIDLDPASCAVANQVIQAKEIFTVQENGLGRPWPGHVYLNPPYGKSEGGVSNQALWSQELIANFTDGLTTEAILLVNASVGEAWFADLLDYAGCLVSRRIPFWTQGPNGERKSQPLKGNAFIYFGPDPTKFVQVFSRFGMCFVPSGKGYNIMLEPMVYDGVTGEPVAGDPEPMDAEFETEVCDVCGESKTLTACAKCSFILCDDCDGSGRCPQCSATNAQGGEAA